MLWFVTITVGGPKCMMPQPRLGEAVPLAPAPLLRCLWKSRIRLSHRTVESCVWLVHLIISVLATRWRCEMRRSLLKHHCWHASSFFSNREASDRLGSIKQDWKNVHIQETYLRLQSDARTPDVVLWGLKAVSPSDLLLSTTIVGHLHSHVCGDCTSLPVTCRHWGSVEYQPPGFSSSTN